MGPCYRRSGPEAQNRRSPARTALVAQRIEHLTTDQKVGGSSPSERAGQVQVRVVPSPGWRGNVATAPGNRCGNRSRAQIETECHPLSPRIPNGRRPRRRSGRTHWYTFRPLVSGSLRWPKRETIARSTSLTSPGRTPSPPATAMTSSRSFVARLMPWSSVASPSRPSTYTRRSPRKAPSTTSDSSGWLTILKRPVRARSGSEWCAGWSPTPRL